MCMHHCQNAPWPYAATCSHNKPAFAHHYQHVPTPSSSHGEPPRNPKEVRKLTGMTIALNRFISRSANRCKPFFQLLNKWKGFEWTEERVLAFQQLKKYLYRPPIMSRPKVDEVLFAYIAVASHAISLVLVRVDNGAQMPVYYVSKSLYKAEVRYLPDRKSVV